MALSKNRNTPQRAVGSRGFPVGAGVILFAGGIGVLNSSGYLVPATTATGLRTVGRIARYFDNSDGGNGADTVEVDAGVFRFANSAAADEITIAEIGQVCYLVNDETVAKTNGSATRSPAGIVDDVDDLGVWVRMGEHALVAPAGALLAANNLADVGNVATAVAALGLTQQKAMNTLASHSGNGALAVSGVNLIAGGTGIAGLTLAAPVAGARCEVRVASLASGSVVVTCAEGVTLDGSNDIATLDAAGEALVLIYHSANRWQVVENVGSVALSAS